MNNKPYFSEHTHTHTQNDIQAILNTCDIQT